MEEGYGYKNWGHLDDDDSYDTSTPPTYTSENYGFTAGTKKRASASSLAGPNDAYNFEYDRGIGPAKSRYQDDLIRASGDSIGQSTRRMSTADRTKQILDSVKRTKPVKDDSEQFTSFQDSWNELMQDLESVPGSASPSVAADGPRTSSPLTPGASESFGTPQSRLRTVPEKGSPFFSPTGSDSFEISAADLEVGSIAARRSKEKALERRRGRQSFDPDHMPPQMSPQGSPRLGNSVMSPDIPGRASPRFKSSAVGGVQESTALSSIDKKDAIKLVGSDGKLYGGVDKSDADMFRMLTESRIKLKDPKVRSVSFGDEPDVGLRPAPESVPQNRRSFSDEVNSADISRPSLVNLSVQPLKTSVESGADNDEYSDEFDEDQDTSKTSKVPAPTMLSDSVEESLVRTAAVNAVATAEAKTVVAPTLSSKDLERRKSMAEIQQRWFSPPVTETSQVNISQKSSPVEGAKVASIKEPNNPPPLALPDPVQSSENTDVSSPHSLPFSSEVPGAVAAKPMARPSPLVTSSIKEIATFSQLKELRENLLQPSVGGSFTAAGQNAHSVDKAVSNAVDVTLESGKSDPPSPPSSAGPSAAASLDEAAMHPSSMTRSNMNSSVAGLFKKVSDADDVGLENDLVESKSRVSFDLNKNERFQAPLHDNKGDLVRKSAAMSVDSLDYSSPNLVDERAELKSRHNVSSTDQTRHHNFDGVLEQSDYDTCIVNQNMRYSPDVQDEPSHSFASSRSPRYDDNRHSYDLRESKNFIRGYAAPTASSIASLRSSGVNIQPSSEQGALEGKNPLSLTLDVVVPSIDELHAQLAMIKAAEKRRREHRVDRSHVRGSWETSRSTGNSTRQRRVVTTGNNVETQSTAPSRRSRSPNRKIDRGRSSSPPPPPPVPAAAPEWDSLSRLEQSNSRLNRQFEDLSNEIKLLRNSTATITTPPRAPRQQHDQHGSPRIEGGIASDQHWKNPSREKATTGASRKIPTVPNTSNSKVLALDSWDTDALSAVKNILRESDDLRKREKTLHEREKVLNIRENLIGQACAAKMKEKAPNIDVEKENMSEEIVTLKSQLFQAQQHIFQLHAAAKAVVEGDGSETTAEVMPQWDSTHYFELTCTYLTRLGRDPRSVHRIVPQNSFKPVEKVKNNESDVVVDEKTDSDGIGGKWINGEYYIPHSVYLKLQRDKLASESLLEATQKENERLMGVLKTQEKDMRTKDATFFDQQAELVKEINRLKNQLRGYSGAPLSNSETRSDGTDFPPKFRNTGIGGLEARMGNEISGRSRKVFEAEAIIWRLQEQLADAESRATERENKLQQAIGRLTLDNEKLTRTAASKTENNIGGTSFINKSSAHQTYFSGQLVGASAGWNDGELPPPPPPVDDQPALVGRNSNSDMPSPHDMAISELQLIIRDERQQHAEEVEKLRTRLKWFAETQVAIDAISEERDNFAEQLKLYSGENQHKGPKVRENDASFSSQGTYRRHPADTKKIKDLENTVTELRDALKKRFPDSISNLLYATSAAGVGADPAELERARKEIAQLKEQLEITKKESDIKLRGLRQEFEKMRVVYEDKMRHVESLKIEDMFDVALDKTKLPASAAAVARRAANSVFDPYGKPWSSNKLNPAKNLNQALARIRELELGESRIRAFYTKKIEDLQRRYENQIHAMKRTGTTTTPIERTSHFENNKNPKADCYDGLKEVEKSLVDSEGQDTSCVSDGSDSACSDRTKILLEEAEHRIALLQNELLTTAEELGRAKKTISALEENLENNQRSKSSPLIVGAQPSPSATSNSTKGNDENRTTIDQLQQEIVTLTQQVQDHRFFSSSNNSHIHFEPVIIEKDRQIAEFAERTAVLQRRLDETSELLHKEMLNQVKAREEWAESQKRLVDKIEALQNETMNQREQMRALQATPEMHNFLVLSLFRT